MKRFYVLAVTGLLVALAAPALAADLPRPVYKAPSMYAPAPIFSWSGAYIGINGGYGWGSSRITTPAGATTGNFDINGGLAGGTLGYNIQAGSIVYGIEGDLDYSWIKGNSAPIAAGGFEVRNRYLATVRGRVGYAFDRFLPYITAGGAFGDVRTTTILGRSTDQQFGWTVGGGLEYAFLGNWSAKLEYLYVRLSNADCPAAVCGLNDEVRFRSNVVRAGLNYRF